MLRTKMAFSLFGSFLIVLLIVHLCKQSWAIDTSPTGFYYPTGTNDLGPYAGWLASSCNGGSEYSPDNYHIGHDFKGTSDEENPTKVYPIADGTIVKISYNGWGTGNVGVLVRHKLHDCTEFLALYGHVKTTLKETNDVYAGVSFATVGPWDDGDHLHFGIYPFSTIPKSDPTNGIGWGIMDCSHWQDTNGFVDPINWLQTKAPYQPPQAIGLDDNFSDLSKWNTSIKTEKERWCDDGATGSAAGPGDWLDFATESCKGTLQEPPYGDVLLSGGQAFFTSIQSRAFPYIWRGPPSKSSPFPSNGDFIFELKMKYDTIVTRGTGIVLRNWADSSPSGDNPSYSPSQTVLRIWADNRGLFADQFGNHGSISGSYNAHIYRLEYLNGAYSLFVDGVLKSGPITSDLMPNTIWIGNPVISYWGVGNWSSFSLDSIKISIPSLSIEVPPNYTTVEETHSQIDTGETHWWDFVNSGFQQLLIILGFNTQTSAQSNQPAALTDQQSAANFSIKIYKPDGALYQETQSRVSPIQVEIPNAQPGQWRFEITAVETPYPDEPYVLAIGAKGKAAATPAILQLLLD